MPPLLRCQTDTCIVCEHPVSAVSPEALASAVQAHVEYVNARLCRATDDHFEHIRVDGLLQA